jgi:hypothetical protein
VGKPGGPNYSQNLTEKSPPKGKYGENISSKEPKRQNFLGQARHSLGGYSDAGFVPKNEKKTDIQKLHKLMNKMV